jgi:3-ketosteroid 9alpha-monooxygenase subunit A
MKVPFTWKPTGWFMIGWSAEFTPGTVKALRYLGQDLVAYRTDDGALHVLDAHCPHLGAHLGHHGKVNGDCVECPYHGWGFGPDGENRYIPYEDRPNVSKQLRTWPIFEMHECVFMWHDPAGGPPRFEVPDPFTTFPEFPGDPAEHYRAYPEVSVKYEREPVHPQISLENTPDSKHFRYVHAATVEPVLMKYTYDAAEYRGTIGWPVPGYRSEDGMAMKLYNVAVGVGGAFAALQGKAEYRLAFFTTPVDDETSDMFYSIWWKRDPGDPSPVLPEKYKPVIDAQFLQTLWDDLEIWRYQKYVENPAFAKSDAKAYTDLRNWAKQFYELPA